MAKEQYSFIFAQKLTGIQNNSLKCFTGTENFNRSA